MCFIISQPRPWPLRCERTMIANSAFSPSGSSCKRTTPSMRPVASSMASIAIEEATGRMLGVVRLHDDPDGENAEFAIIVRSHLKGHGLGWLMMKHMIAYAKQKGLKTVRGQVLAENSTMLQMCGELGFHATDDPDERGVKQVTLPLGEVPAEAMH